MSWCCLSKQSATWLLKRRETAQFWYMRAPDATPALTRDAPNPTRTRLMALFQSTTGTLTDVVCLIKGTTGDSKPMTSLPALRATHIRVPRTPDLSSG